jgi:hypothetical protein
MTIVTKLFGGLGNQLFQYAAARYLGLKLGRPVKVDLAWFNDIGEGQTPRIPLLSHFRLPIEHIDSKGQELDFLAPQAENLLHALTRPARILKEKRHFRFDRHLERLVQRSRFAYLDGYWQSYRYFENARAELLDDLTPLAPLDPHYDDVVARIRATQAVMVHVRRGDYVTSKSAANVHGALPMVYYERALALVTARVKHPELFVFSDDIDWVKAHLHSDLPATYVTNAPGAAAVIDELSLMRQCKHHVIANSSLSWWGAWLGNSPQQTVIAPKGWLNERSLDLVDLIPASWQVLDTTKP